MSFLPRSGRHLSQAHRPLFVFGQREIGDERELVQSHLDDVIPRFEVLNGETSGAVRERPLTLAARRPDQDPFQFDGRPVGAHQIAKGEPAGADETLTTITDADGTEHAVTGGDVLDVDQVVITAWHADPDASVASGAPIVEVAPAITALDAALAILNSKPRLRARWEAATELRSDDQRVRDLIAQAGAEPDAILVQG